MEARAIGSLELAILSIISNGNASTRAICEKLQEVRWKDNNRVSRSMIQTVISRMVAKGLLSKRNIPPKPVRGGRSSYEFALLNDGQIILEKYMCIFQELWS